MAAHRWCPSREWWRVGCRCLRGKTDNLVLNRNCFNDFQRTYILVQLQHHSRNAWMGEEKNENKFLIEKNTKIHRHPLVIKSSDTFRTHRTFHTELKWHFSISGVKATRVGQLSNKYSCTKHKSTVKQWSRAASNGHVFSGCSTTFCSLFIWTMDDGRWTVNLNTSSRHMLCIAKKCGKNMHCIRIRFDYKVWVAAACSYECNE